MCAVFATMRTQVCQYCMPMKIPIELQRRTCAAEKHLSANFLRHRCNIYIVKSYVFHYVV